MIGFKSTSFVLCVFILLHFVLLEKITFRFIRASHFVLPDLGGDEKPIPIRIACYCLEKYNESSLGEFIQFDPMQNQSVFYIKK